MALTQVPRRVRAWKRWLVHGTGDHKGGELVPWVTSLLFHLLHARHRIDQEVLRTVLGQDAAFPRHQHFRLSQVGCVQRRRHMAEPGSAEAEHHQGYRCRWRLPLVQEEKKRALGSMPCSSTRLGRTCETTS